MMKAVTSAQTNQITPDNTEQVELTNDMRWINYIAAKYQSSLQTQNPQLKVEIHVEIRVEIHSEYQNPQLK